MLLSDLGVALRKARKERGLTLKQVGERAGVHFTTLSSLERGRVSEFGVRKLLRVAETLGLELVLRPEGQRYTLDDVARERVGLDKKADRPQERSEDALAGYEGHLGQRVTLQSVAKNTRNLGGGSSSKQDELNRRVDLAKGSNQPAGFLGSAPTRHQEVSKLSELVKSLDQGGLLNSVLTKNQELSNLSELAKSLDRGGLLNSVLTKNQELSKLSELAKSLEQGGLLARALRRPLHNPPNFDAVDDATVSKSKKSK